MHFGNPGIFPMKMIKEFRALLYQMPVDNGARARVCVCVCVCVSVCLSECVFPLIFYPCKSSKNKLPVPPFRELEERERVRWTFFYNKRLDDTPYCTEKKKRA